MQQATIDIPNDFSRYPAGRYISDGPYNGTKFRDDFLIEPLKSHRHTVLMFDGARGYGSSFLEEAFGGLVRLGFNKAQILETFEFISNSDPTLPNEIIDYINDAEKGG